MKNFALLALVALALTFAAPAFAQNSYTQFPTYCTPAINGGTAATNSSFYFYPQGGAYASPLPPGLYLCTAPNVAAPFMGGGASKQLLLADVATTTAAASVFSYPLLANTNYTFSCTLFWQNSSTNADTFTVAAPTSPTAILAYLTSIYTAAGAQVAAPLSGGPPLTGTGGTAGVGSTTYKAIVDGGIQNGANAGNLAFQISATSGTATIKAGSYCTVNSAP
jgi:hypothetical protein